MTWDYKKKHFWDGIAMSNEQSFQRNQKIFKLLNGHPEGFFEYENQNCHTLKICFHNGMII